MPEASRGAVRRARERGVRVDVRSGAGASHVPARGWEVLGELLPRAGAGARVTLTPSRGAGGEMRLAVVPGLPGVLPASPGVVVSGSVGLTLLRVSTEEPTAAPARLHDGVAR